MFSGHLTEAPLPQHNSESLALLAAQPKRLDQHVSDLRISEEALVTRFVGLREHCEAQLHINNEAPESTHAIDPSNKGSIWLVANR